MKRFIYMIGDSIMQTNQYPTYPQTGWGQVLSLFTKEDVEVINLAKNGTSSKSFLDQGRFLPVEKNIKKGDCLIIGFGHNDEKIKDPLRYTSPYDLFQKNLEYFIEVAKEKEAFAVLTTPVIRRKFQGNKLEETHGVYPEAIRFVAKKNKVPCIDLNQKTKKYYEALGEEKSMRNFMHFPANIYENYPNGSEDDSHQRYEGAVLIAKFFVEGIMEQNLPLKEFFLPLPKPISCASDTYEN